MRYSQRGAIAVAVILTGALAACATGTESDEANQESMVGQIIETGDDGDRMVCRRQRVIGSNVPRTVCKSEAQLKAEREAAVKAVGPLRPMTGYQRQRDPGQDPR